MRCLGSFYWGAGADGEVEWVAAGKVEARKPPIKSAVLKGTGFSLYVKPAKSTWLQQAPEEVQLSEIDLVQRFLRAEFPMGSAVQLFDRINEAKHLFLRSIKESGINQLELVFEEAIVNEAKRGKMESSQLPADLAFLLEDAAPIESVDGCIAFRMHWKRYTAFLVTEECVGGGGQYADEAYLGHLLRIYSKSHFLEHLARDTGGHTAPLMHYKIISENHVVDGVAEIQPEIEIVPNSARNWIQ
jgi:hypothetical protein